MTETKTAALPGAAANQSVSPPSNEVAVMVATGGDVPRIPALPEDVDTLSAALAYGEAGWYLAPVRRGDYKNPGSVLGKSWQTKTFRDPEQIVAHFAGTDCGIALHLAAPARSPSTSTPPRRRRPSWPRRLRRRSRPCSAPVPTATSAGRTTCLRSPSTA